MPLIGAAAHEWIDSHWSLPIYSSVLYLLMVHVFGPRFMATRNAFSLKRSLTLWNAFLSIFSCIGLFFLGRKTFRRVLSVPFGDVDQFFCAENEVASEDTWILYFILSKIFEFMDTVFLILRKKDVIFLHWYHHVATLLYSWWGWHIPQQRGIDIFGTVNFFVHTFMYGYYGFMSAGYKVPGWVAKPITKLQIIQMFIGMGTCLYSSLSPRCLAWGDNWYPIMGFFMYVSYAVLFLQMFFAKYDKSNAASKKSD